jgi:hypothetical protein
MHDDGFDPRALPRSFYDQKIRDLTDQHGRLVEAAGDVLEEIKWWTAGRDRFVPEADNSDQKQIDGLEESTEELGIAPENLRAAIRFVLRQDGPMKPAEVIAALTDRGWAPTAKSGAQMVRNRMLAMRKDELDYDHATGIYSLSAYETA